MTQQTIIPSSERQLAEANLGDVILVSYLGRSDLESVWTLLNSKQDDKYMFIAHDKTKFPEDKELVIAYSCPLSKIQFDRYRGAILNHLYQGTSFFGPQREEYVEMVEKLRSANLWRVK